MKEKTILINGVPFSYMDERGDPYVFNMATDQDMAAILNLATSLLSDCGIEYVLAFGTLLGAVRESSFIQGDDDVDIIITDEERLCNSLPYLSGHGLFINRIFEKELYTFHMDGRRGHLDMYVLRPIDKWLYKNWCVSVCGHYTPKRFFQGVIKDRYRIDGEMYCCPEDAEGYLKWLYGKNWRIPQSKKGKSGVFPQRLAKFPSKYWGKIMRKIKRIR